jgi:hypothetical protein
MYKTPLGAKGIKTPAIDVLRRDVHCLLRCYLPHAPSESLSEDLLLCPLISLELLQPHDDGARLVSTSRDDLPDSLVVAAIADAMQQKQTQIMPFSELMWGEYGGRLFRMSEDALLDRVARLDVLTSGAANYSDHGGVRAVQWADVVQVDITQIALGTLQGESRPMTNRYLRSVNIAHDLSQSGHELHGYMACPLVLQTVARIMRGCDDASNGRAFSIIGHYGTGKSAFGVFLAHWVAANPDARVSLWSEHTLMEQRIVPFDSVQLLPIPLLVKATTLRQAIVATCTNTLVTARHSILWVPNYSTPAKTLIYPPKKWLLTSGCSPKAVLPNTQYHGVMLIIDELGQHLAHIHRSGDSRDLFVLQTIAKLAARSGDTPIMVITILHQTFERYSTTAGASEQTKSARYKGAMWTWSSKNRKAR